jgi:predicted transposase YdaD
MSTEENADERIQSPHDRLINQTLQQLDAARALLSEHLPRELAEHLQFHTLAPVDTSFIDANLRRRFADRLFQVDVDPEIVKRLRMKVNDRIQRAAPRKRSTGNRRYRRFAAIHGSSMIHRRAIRVQ